jgi:hypothetical protein
MKVKGVIKRRKECQGEQGVEAMRSGLALKFNDEKAFGSFCQKLKEERVPFSLAGNRTVIISSVEQVSEIPEKARTWFDTLKEMGLVEILPSVPAGRRTLPTEEEAKKLFRERAKKYA